MQPIQNYDSTLSNDRSRKSETFSYLPPMDEAGIRQQITYIVQQGWQPAIEFCEPEFADAHYWYMWKLPLFGETDVDKILAELNACRAAYPNYYVRLIGYDPYKQTQGTAMVVYRDMG